jgi:3-deoxy-D-manno-octulosonate 8-phosphate phosphatase (KDO 8-P phosphatase)
MSKSLAEIQAIAFDVDGVLTDGSILWGPSGEEWKRFHFADIMGVSLARRAGIVMALVSGEDSPLVTRYAEKMHIQHVHKGVRDKAAALREFSAAANVPLLNVCFMGDDINDLPAMTIAGLAAAPSNACADVLSHLAATSGFLCTHTGGNGAVRELIEALLAARNLNPLDLFQNVR